MIPLFPARLRPLAAAATICALGGLLMAPPSKAAAPAAQPAAPRVLEVAIQGAPFSTIQAALNEARPGDTVLVRGGVYREAVTFPIAGEPGRPITLKAHPGHIVLVTPSRELAGKPEPVPGRPEVFRWADFDPPGDGAIEKRLDALGIWEASSQLRLVRMSSLDECENRLGSWMYDAKEKALYIRGTGAAPADSTPYVLEDAARSCVHIQKPHAAVEGLWLAFGANGILLGTRASHVGLRGNRLFCNRAAGIYASGDDHEIVDNTAFRNNMYGIQMRFNVNRLRVARNLCYFNGPNNGDTTDVPVPADLTLYSKSSYIVIEDNVVVGLHQNAFRNKYGGNNTNVFRRNVVKGFFDCAGRMVRDNTVLTNGIASRFGFYPMRVNPLPPGIPEAVDPDGERRRHNIFHPVFDKTPPLFADPAWHDYRLQEGCSYTGRGAYPERSLLLYVDPINGDDANSGRSADKPLKTFARLNDLLHPGETVYLAPGEYAETLSPAVGGMSAAEPSRFRAFGRSEKVVLKGGLSAEGLRHVSFEGLVFQGPIQLTKTVGASFRECVIAGGGTALALDECQDARIDHATFGAAEFGLRVRQSVRVGLTNSIFADQGVCVALDSASVGAFYEDHNVFAKAEWKVSRSIVRDMDAWRSATGFGRSSRVGPVELGPDWSLPAGSPLACAAADMTFAGARPAPAAVRLEIRGPAVAGLHPQGASFLWSTPRGATEARVSVRPVGGGDEIAVEPVLTFQAMGEFFDMTFRLPVFYTTQRHATISGLKPGTEYEAKVTAFNAERTASNSTSLRFTTPADAPQGRTFHVSASGDDAADGLDKATAWRTFRRATAQAGPGDTVLVHPGRYPETLRPRIAGAPGRPVVFQSVEPRGAVIDLMQTLPCGVEIANVDNVQVKGFKLVNGRFGEGTNFRVSNARNVRLSDCHVDYPPGMSFEKLRLGHGGLIAVDSPGIEAENNVFLCGVVGVAVSNCPGARIASNTIIGEGNYGVVVIPGAADQSYRIESNIFYRAIMGYKTGPNIWVMNIKPDLFCDRNLFYIAEGTKATLGKLPATDRLPSLEAWQTATGLDRHSLAAQPIFLDPEKGDFRLAPNSPGIKLAEDGGPVGAR